MSDAEAIPVDVSAPAVAAAESAVDVAAPISPASPPASPAAEVHVHVPYQADFVTPRQSIQATSSGSPSGSPAPKSGRAAASGGTSPAAKLKGRPSQAPVHAARVARGKDNGPRRSSSAGPLVRSQRRQPSATPTTAAVQANGASPTVLSSPSRRIAAPAVMVTRTSNNNILLRRPRFVDPLASSTPPPTATPHNTPTETSPVAQPIRQSHRRGGGGGGGNSGTSSLLSSTMPPPPPSNVVSHASLYIHPVPHHAHTHTPQRAPASSLLRDSNGGGGGASAAVHHRRRLLPAGKSAAHRPAPATPAVSLTHNTATTATSATNNTATAAAAAVSVSSLSRSLTPTAASDSTELAEAVEVHAAPNTQEVEALAADAPVANGVSTTAAATEAATTTTTTAASKFATPVPQRESHVRVMPTTLAMHPDKKVIHSRPTSGASLRMSELTRPSEAYKLPLNASLQSTALARRSRQPRKVLNVYLTKYPVIRKLADELGWSMETTEDELNEYKFNLCWSDTVLSLMRLVRLSNWQRTNHFPSMYLLCRKGHLGTTLGRLRHKLPSHFTFYPRTWSMRSERLQFTQYMTAVRQRRILKYFIMKPNSGCQGRGIIVARDPLTALDEHTLDNYIVQEYVHRPLLLEGKKFDLRVYVLLTSIRNPSIFIFNDGLVRICTEAYEAPTEENVKNACKHLTNYAVNKRSTEYVFNTDVAHMDVGNKRNFSFLNRWLDESGYSSVELWRQVGIIITKTILAAQPSIARVYDSCFPTGFNDGYCCFEVLGFDILIDQKMRPWLMEVNHTPSFATETPLDFDIKSKLLTEVWSIIDCKPTDYERDRQREREEFTKRNMPPWSSNHPLYSSQLRQSSSRFDAAATNDDGVESPVNVGTPLTGEQSTASAAAAAAAAGTVPAYVHARRAHEDSKLRNFTRIYPSEDPEVQVVYDTIQNLALAESANNRLYYNSTVAVPVVPPPLPPPPSATAAALGLHSSNVVPLRARPPLLGPLHTTARANGTSPVTAQSQRGLASPAPQPPSTSTSPTAAAAAAMAPPNGAPETLPVSSVPSLAVIRDGHGGLTPSTPAISTTSPHAPSSVASRGDVSGRARVHRVGTSSRASTTRTSIAPSDATGPAPPLSALSVTSMNTAATASNATTPKAGDAAAAASGQPVRIFTPRVSTSVANSRSTTAASTPSAAVAKTHQNNNNNGAAAVNGSTATVKPRVTEVHRRAQSRPSAVSPNAATAQQQVVEPEEALSGLNAAHATPPPAGEALNASRDTPSKSERDAPHGNGEGAQRSQPTSASHRIARSSNSRQKSPSLETSVTQASKKADDAPHPHLHPQQQQQLSSSLRGKRPSMSMSGSGRDAFEVPAAVHPRQKSTDHEGRSMSTHPEPTEEELARLVALQAQLDYEAAADPQPDDEDDYNLTE